MKHSFYRDMETLLGFRSIKRYETYIHHADDQLKHVPCIQ